MNLKKLFKVVLLFMLVLACIIIPFILKAVIYFSYLTFGLTLPILLIFLVGLFLSLFMFYYEEV